MNRFLDRLDPDMCVVTATSGGERAGCLVGFASQCSIRPTRFVVWLSKVNRTHEVAAAAEFLAVHLLTRDEHRLAALFGGETGHLADKFARAAWTSEYGGATVLRDACAWFVGRIERRVDGGDHTGHVLAPVQSGAHGATPHGTPLLRMADARTIDPGHPVD
ncbi:oxidoreductase [Streptomyces zinciresistens K42]|uniref:Oxidoreductase n=2 Tax=Streptomyces TaxID=1883 RepID=G2GDG8_9ACTN|nr:oxidoreductase [Streptomyces zinciresistens K42]